MSDNSWVLRGVDPETRQKAVTEAERRGMSLSDYLTDVVLQGAVVEQMSQPAPAEPDTYDPTPGQSGVGRPAENFAVRHRLETIERRLSLSVGGLDSTVRELDSSVFGLASRLDDAETFAAETADAVTVAMQEVGANLTAIRKRLGDAEDGVEALNEGLEAARGEAETRSLGIEHRLNNVEDIARSADAAIGVLGQAHETLKYAVAEDFSAFARESAARLGAGLEEVRTAADAAAAQADAAVAHLIAELRDMRIALEDSLGESAADTRARMQAAFADAADRMASLAERVTENERYTARTADQLRGQIADVEDGAQTALEETAETLRQAGASLAADLARATQDTRTALESVHGDLSSELAELRERQVGGLARLKVVDAAVSTTINDLGELRETARRNLHQAQSDWDARFDAITARLAGAEGDGAQARQVFAAEIERVEACTLAALEKLNGDLAIASYSAEEAATATRDILAAQIADIRDQHIGAMARLKLLDKALGAHDLIAAAETAGPVHDRLARLEADIQERALDREVAARLGRLELNAGRGDIEQKLVAHQDVLEAHATALGEQQAAYETLTSRVTSAEITLDEVVAAQSAQQSAAAEIDARIAAIESIAAERIETKQAVIGVARRVEALAEQLEAQRIDDSLFQRIDDLRGRLAASEAQAGEAADRVHGVARMLGRLTAQNADASTQSEERLHKLELAVADLRLEQFSTGETPLAAANLAEGVQAIEQRVAEMERRQVDVFEQLRADIAHFIGENDRRLAALETSHTPVTGFDGLAEAIDARFDALEQRDLAAEFEKLRQRLDDRILGVEQRSVRALEQVADTVALIEQRFSHVAEAAAKTA